MVEAGGSPFQEKTSNTAEHMMSQLDAHGDRNLEAFDFVEAALLRGCEALAKEAALHSKTAVLGQRLVPHGLAMKVANERESMHLTHVVGTGRYAL